MIVSCRTAASAGNPAVAAEVSHVLERRGAVAHPPVKRWDGLSARRGMVTTRSPQAPETTLLSLRRSVVSMLSRQRYFTAT